MANYRKMASIASSEALAEHAASLGVSLPVEHTIESGPDAPLAKPIPLAGKTAGNRLCVLPMEGWDCERDGAPGPLTVRRWERFGAGGAKLIWGGEAAAVRPDGRSNTRQLLAVDRNMAAIERMRLALVRAHEAAFGTSSDLVVGLQLTHSGRFSKPNDDRRLESLIPCPHPVLDRKFGTAHAKILTDDDVRRLVEDFARAAALAAKAGFDFVDIKQCHGYLGHEFLSAVDRPGPYGGSFENRTRFMRECVQAAKAAAPGLHIGVRLSLFDFIPYKKGPDGVGVPEEFDPPYRRAFGGDGTGLGYDLAEPLALIDMLDGLGVRMLCATVGSPYYNPHIQRPAMFPPSDGYLPPEDPLVGVARQIRVAAEVKQARPGMTVVGSGYTYLQEWFPHVAQAVVRAGMADIVGLGRMTLPYPDIFRDVLEGRPLQKRRICRTFSDCTTAPRHGIVSGCYPLDDYYKNLPEAALVKAAKAR